MRFNNYLIQYFFGKPEENSLEDQITLVIAFTTAILSLLAITLNQSIELPFILTILPLIAAGILLFIFYKLRQNRKKHIYKLLLAFIALVYFNFVWFTNGASTGPTLMLFLIMFIFLLFVFEGIERFILSIVLLTNIFGLAVIEYTSGIPFSPYKDNHMRIIDMYASFLISVAFSTIIALIIRYYYRLERSRAMQSDRLKSAFLANISHEIRTPMNAILGFSKLIEMAGTERERHDYINIINTNGEILIELIDNILDMSKLDSGRYDFVIKPFKLRKLTDDLIKTTRQSLDIQGKSDVKLSLKVNPNDVTILSDEFQLRKVLNNLLNNAVKFTMKGEITFGYETRDGQVRFFVSDTGIGIKQEDMGAIFDRFYKVENSEFTSLPRGSGIGLTISEMIVEKLGGRFAFDSVYGKGSTFSFIIPAKSYLESDLGNALKSTSSSRAGKVLVTEDEESNMLLITTLLTRMKVPFYTSSNGAEALELYKSGKKISLVLMDINMPLMNGFDAMIALKKLNPDLPVVALTAYAMQIEKQKALDAGFNDYLSKPVNQKHLEDCFKRFIGFESPVNQA